MNEIILFLVSVFVISLSGVLAPGPVTAATIAMGLRDSRAGAKIALGHGIIELPLMLVIVAGFDIVLKNQAVQILIGVIGGAVLVWMGAGMLRQLENADYRAEKHTRFGPFATGFVLSVSNPYFLLWWATVGLKLAVDARGLGAAAFVLFVIIHWTCDLVWLEALSFSSFKGSRVLGGKNLKIVLGICSAALIFFGVQFVYDSLIKVTGQ